METEKNALMRIPDNFANRKIIVVGDVMLDKHLEGDVSRISPEAPIPILKVDKETYNPGGAANLANNIASLGATVHLFGVVGNDDAQRLLFHSLEEKGINTDSLIKTKRQTIQKIRGISKQHLFRIDYEDGLTIDEENEQKLWVLIKDKIPEVDAIILSDYNKGTLTESLIKNIISFAKNHNKLLTADCKPKKIHLYKGIDVLKPNKKESLEMTGAGDVEEAGKMLSEDLNSNIIITCGAEGTLIFEMGKDHVHIPTKAKKIYDVSGAGDTFLAVFTLSLACKSSFKDAVELANEAAGIVVSKPGTATLSMGELRNSLNSTKKVVQKVWGEEQWIENNERYCGKKLFVKKEHYSSYHNHKDKEETFYVLDGDLEVIYNGEYVRLLPGDTLKIEREVYHSFRAIEDTTFFEFSTQHLDEDNYRLTTSSSGSHEKWKQEIYSEIQNDKSNFDIEI